MAKAPHMQKRHDKNSGGFDLDLNGEDDDLDAQFTRRAS